MLYEVTWNLLQNICRKRILMDFQRNGLQEAYLGKLYHTLGCLGDATAWEKQRPILKE